MDEFILWCNQNVGFVSLLLSALTLITSVIAIIVSVHTARLPYRKKLLVDSGTYITATGSGLHITATNIGNRNLKIKTIGFLIKKQVLINTDTLFDSQIILNQGDQTSQYFDTNDLKRSIIKLNISKNTYITAFVEDSEGKKYKKKLTKAKAIFNQGTY